MAFVQKDRDMGRFNITVQINDHLEFELVPEEPHTKEVHMHTLVFHTPSHPNITVNNARADRLYRVELHGNQLQVHDHPIG